MNYVHELIVMNLSCDSWAEVAELLVPSDANYEKGFLNQKRSLVMLGDIQLVNATCEALHVGG